MSNRKRVVSLTIVALFAVCALFAYFSRKTTQAQQPASQADRERLARTPAPKGTLKDRLAKDDGYAATIFFSADIGGNLEVCGCPIRPLGGIARRLGYINAYRQRTPDATTLMVDAGHIFSDEGSENGTLNADAKLMSDWIVRANEQMEMSVVNLSYRDLPYAQRLFDANAALKPEKTTLISANVKIPNANIAPYTIKTLTAKRLKKPVRMAFIGLSEAPPNDKKDALAKQGFTFADPLEAASATLAEVKDKADLNVIVGYFKPGTAHKLATQNNELDLIIAYDDRGIVPDPKQVNNALIVYATRQSKYLGELRMYADAAGEIERFTTRYVELDSVIPDDPAMLETTKKARAEIGVVQQRMAEEVAAAHAAKGNQSSLYVTSETCAKCHQEEYDKWKQTRHSHAFAVLETKNRAFDNACVGCHSVGFQKQGFVNIKATPQLAHVQCESCHGPGAEHAAKPQKGFYKTPPTPSMCITCHDRENSPDFVFDKYWPVVAHGKK
ncbi:MAG TPA: multiheme c-type cytochrome [Blastocatellia bacterium]|nr:multiheme c-type cytochrome [Blastocatellia bacterium]